MAKINSTIFKQETIKSWFSGVGASVNNEVIQPFQNANSVISKYNLAIQHNSLTQQGWQRLLAQSDDSLKAYLTSIKGSTASMAGYNVALQGSITGFTKVSNAIKQYNALGAVSFKEQQAFATAVSATNSKLGAYLIGLNGSTAGLRGYGVSLVASTAKTIGLTVATTALNAAMTMGISVIVTGLISAFTAWINKSEEITEKAQEAADKINSISESLKTNTETVENAKKRYAELAQEVENLGKITQSQGTLSNEEYEEFLDLSNQLAGIFPSLTKNYDENGNAILDLSGDVNTIVGSLDDLIQKEKELANQKIMEEFPDVFKGYAQDVSNAEQKVKSAQIEFDKINQAYNALGKGQSIQMGFNVNGYNVDTNTHMGTYISWLEDLGLTYEKMTVQGGHVVTAVGDIDVAFTTKLEEARENLQYAQQQLEGEKSSIDSYLNTWLQGEFSYVQIDDSGLQTAIQDMLFNFDFSNIPENKRGDWNYVSEYLRRNILFEINKVQDDPVISKAISEVFSNTELTPNEKANYLQQIQDYFGEDSSIVISLKPQIEETNTLQKQYDKAIEDTKDKFDGYDPTAFFKENSINTQEEVDKWLEIAQAANSAADAEERYVQGSTSDNEITVFSGFSEEQTNAIDDFKSKVKTLGDTLSSLQLGKDVDITELVKEFPTLASQTHNLDEAIKFLINDSLQELLKLLGTNVPNSVSQALNDIATEAIGLTPNLEETFSTIQTSYKVLHEFEDALKNNSLDDGILSSVAGLSGALNDLVAGFYAGTVTSEELFNALSAHYNTDLKNYGNALIAKNALSYEFYNATVLSNTELVNSFKDNYGVDISNCKSYNEAKLKIEQETLRQLGNMWSKYYNAQTQTYTAEMLALEGQIETDPYAEQAYAIIKGQIDAYETAVAALNNITYEGIGANFDTIGDKLIKDKGTGSSSSSKEAKKETIDWIERYNEMLQRQHDILDEIANDETQSYNERIGALDEMIAKDKERIDIAQKSAQEYKEAWEKAIEGLSNKDISNIMNGSLDIETYDESVLGEEYIDKLKEAMDLYDKFLDMKQKVSDVEKESLDHMREQLKLEEEIIQAEQELIDTKRSVTDANLDYIEASGGVVNAGLYKQQIALSKELESTYHDQIANLEEQIELVDEGSAEYYSLLAAMDDCQAAIIDCQTEQAELNEAIARIPIERLQKYINMLRNIKTDLQNFLDEQSALGINPTADQLQQLIDLSHKEISKLTEQQKELSGLLETYEYGSEKFNEVQDEIQNIDDEISSLIQNQREWNTELLNIPIENLEKVNDNLSTYSSILGEQIDEQEKAYNAVISHLDREIEKYEELKDAVNDKYDPEIEAIQEKIDLLDKTNEKLSIQQRLEQANYDYNKALNNKNILTINEKGEQEYISDIDALREATVEKQEAELAKLKFDLNESKELLEEQKQKELDALDAEIERIEKIQDVWTKVKEEVESISDILSANNVLGSNWQNIVLAGGTENEDLANSWASMYETLTTQKDSVDKQIESNERIISMMNEFVERFNSGALTYEQALNGVNELSHNIEKGYTAMEQLVDMMNLDGIKDLSGISSSADSQIVDSVDLLRDYLGVANDNNTAINEIAKTWTEMQQSIQDQLAELKRLAEELAKKKETAVVFYSDSYEDRYDDDDGSSDGPDTVTKYWVAAGPGFSEEGLRQAIDDGYAIKFDGAGGDPDFGGDNYRSEEEIRDLYEDILDEIETRHTGAAAGPISTTGLSKADKLFQKYALEPDERLTNTKVGEWVITPEQRDNILKAIDFGGLNNNIALSPKLPPISMRETTKSIEVNMGNIVLEGVQDPDGFARAMKAQFGPLLRQEMSKVK